MAIDGKKRYNLYLTEENVSLVTEFLDRRQGQGGLSGLVDEYITNVARTLRHAKIVKGKKLSLANIIRLGLHGFKNAKHIK